MSDLTRMKTETKDVYKKEFMQIVRDMYEGLGIKLKSEGYQNCDKCGSANIGCEPCEDSELWVCKACCHFWRVY